MNTKTELGDRPIKKMREIPANKSIEREEKK